MARVTPDDNPITRRWEGQVIRVATDHPECGE